MELVTQALPPPDGGPWSTRPELTHILIPIPACGQGRGRGELTAFLSEAGRGHCTHRLCSQDCHAAQTMSTHHVCSMYP